MDDGTAASPLRLALPKGRMQAGVARLLADAGLHLSESARDYRPLLTLPDCEVKLLKPQAVVEMLQAGSRDLGFTGADWTAELDGRLQELLDTGLDPVRLVAAAPPRILEDGRLPRRPLVVVSEFERLTRAWIQRRRIEARFVRSYGATEVYPPEDADVILDLAASGATLQANGLVVVDEIMRSSTRLYAGPGALDNPATRQRIEDLVMLLRSVLEARGRVMVEVNVPADRLESILGILPCMRRPTVAPLAGEDGFAVKAAVPREQLPRVIPLIKARGGSDVVVTVVDQIIP